MRNRVESSGLHKEKVCLRKKPGRTKHIQVIERKRHNPLDPSDPFNSEA